VNTHEFKRKLTAVFSADVAGYSRLMGENEAATVKTLESYKQIMFSLIKQHRGRVIDSPGDNLLAEFASVVDAVQCGVAVQKELQARNAELPENRRMLFRIGINLGDVIEEQDRIYGDGVNIAARLESCADPGGICVSKTAFDHIETKLPLGYEYLGEKEVKNIAKPVGAYRVLMEPRVTVAGAKDKKPSIPLWRRKGVLACATAVLVVIIGVAVWNFYRRAPRIEPASKEKMAYSLPDKPSIAVLPFTNMTGDASQEFLVDGLTENLITSLARVPQLFVIARNSTFVYKNKGVKVQQVAEELGIQYVLEGSVQRSGEKVRITAQFIDALKGRHLWADQYDREMKDLFQLTDEVTNKVLKSVYIKLTGREEAQLRQVKQAKNTESLFKAFEVIQAMRAMNPKDNAQAKRLAEELTTMDPDWWSGFTLLARAYYMEVVLGYSNSPKESLAKALELAQKAVALDEFSPTNYDTLGYVYSLMGEHERALVEFEKGSTLCPSCADSYMYTGYTQYCMDDTEKAIVSLQTALRLNPYPPPYYYLQMGNAYRHVGRYEDAISWYKKSLQVSPNIQMAYVGLASCYSLLGRQEEARSSAQELLRVNPKFTVEAWAKTMPYKNREKLVRYADALRKAGLPDKPPLPLPDKPSIAVLPFVNMSDDKSQEYFSDGLTEEIITALSKTPKLFVIARNSTFVYKGKPVNVQQVSRELGVKYVLEGSVRRSRDQLRITAQLIDATTGNHLWAERYDREMKEIFAVQDDITMKITSALQVKLTEGEGALLRIKGTNNLDAYLKFLEGWEASRHWNKESHAKARKLAEETIDLDPEYQMGHFLLATVEVHDIFLGLSKSPKDTLVRAIEMAKRSIAIEDSPFPHTVLAVCFNLLRKHEEAIAEAQKAVEISPNYADGYMILGHVLWLSDMAEKAVPVLQKAIRLNPHPPSQYFHNLAWSYYLLEKYDEAIAQARNAIGVSPKDIVAHRVLVCSYVSLDRQKEAREHAEEVLRIDPNFSVDQNAKTSPLKNEDKVKQITDSYRKAGLK